MNRFEGKTALVTGASGGIGRAIAVRLGSEGARVAVHYGGSQGKARETLDLIEEAGGSGELFQADLGDVDAIRGLFNAIDQTLGVMHILVNNAGIADMKPIAAVTPEDFDRFFHINARAYLFCIQEAAKRLPAGGRIVNVASGAAEASRPGIALYGGTRAAVKAFARAAAQELAPLGIIVNTVSPGPVVPGLAETLPPDIAAKAKMASPYERFGHADEVAATVAFLASQDCTWVAGQDIAVDGAKRS